MKSLLQTLAATLFATLINSSVAAQATENRYISDKLYVPLRSGMGTQFRITHRGLPSSTKLKLIEEHQEEGWSLVETDKGDQGWIRNQYLLKEPTAKLKLATVEQKIINLESQRSELKKQVAQLQQQNSKLKSELQATEKSALQLGSELGEIKQISSSAINLHQRHQELMESHQLLQTQADVLKAENARMQADRRYREWLYGAGILLLGVIATLVAQSAGKRKRHSEWG